MKCFARYCLAVVCLWTASLFFSPLTAATECSYSSDHPYKLWVDLLDQKVQGLVCNQKVYSDDGLCTSGSQDEQTDFYDKGQFGGLDQRNQEAVYTLAFLYQEPCSAYYKDTANGPDILNRVLFGLDYLRRAQGEEGGISGEGWKGADYSDVDCDCDVGEKSACDDTSKCDDGIDNGSTNCESDDEADPECGSATSAGGFTFYAAARAISLLADDATFDERVSTCSAPPNDLGCIAIGGDGVADDSRNEAYARLMAQGVSFLTDTGRGHAANQDVWALLALHALNHAYDDLGYSLASEDPDLHNLLDDLDGELDGLREEILLGSPDYTIAGNNEASGENSDGDGDCNGDGDDTDAGEGDGGNGFDRWFTDGALLLEKGYRDTTVCEPDTKSVGYDGNYAWVTLRGLALLRLYDTSSIVSDFFESYVNWFQYFFYVDLSYEHGGYQVSAIARRKWQDGDIKLPGAGLAQDQPAMHTLFNAALEHFVADPDAFFSDLNNIYTGLTAHADLLLNWVEPSLSTYLLPLNHLNDGDASDFSDYTDYQTDQTGALISLLEITSTGNTPGGVSYHVNDWWNGEKEYFYGASTATIEISGTANAPCTLYGRGTDFYCCEDDTCCKQGNGDDDDDYADDGTLCKNLSDCSPTIYSECYNSDRVLEHITNCVGCNGSGSLTLTVEAATPTEASISDVDIEDSGTGDGIGNFFDDDDDGDGMPDTWEAAYGLNSLDDSDASSDPDADGLTNLQEYTGGYDPNVFDNPDLDSDGDGIGDLDEIAAGTDPLNPPDMSAIMALLLENSDEDDDGYDAADDGGNDCDDTLSSVYPGATEICGNDADENCDGITTACDTDGDGVSDDIDLCPTTAAIDSNDTVDISGCALSERDSDGDGLNDYEEIQTYGTAPDNNDTDGDGIDDGTEVSNETDPLNPPDMSAVMTLLLENSDEDDEGHDAASDDTDGDGLNDDVEVTEGSDPTNSSSTACVPPPSGTDWAITRNCAFFSSKTWSGYLYVQSNATMTIPDGLSLDMDFTQKRCVISTGSGVLIQQGGTLH